MSSDKVSFKLEGTFLCGGPSSRALNPANHTWIGDRDQGWDWVLVLGIGMGDWDWGLVL